MSQLQKQILLLIGIASLLGSMAWIANPSRNTYNPTPATTILVESPLVADNPIFDFGTISMANGPVKHLFRLHNSSINPVMIRQIYTSCMCTQASLLIPGGAQFGPFGMPGHGVLNPINQELKPGQEAIVEVSFDPAAHGPAGVGRVLRQIYIETNNATALVLQITANVTP